MRVEVVKNCFANCTARLSRRRRPRGYRGHTSATLRRGAWLLPRREPGFCVTDGLAPVRERITRRLPQGVASFVYDAFKGNSSWSDLRVVSRIWSRLSSPTVSRAATMRDLGRPCLSARSSIALRHSTETRPHTISGCPMDGRPRGSFRRLMGRSFRSFGEKTLRHAELTRVTGFWPTGSFQRKIIDLRRLCCSEASTGILELDARRSSAGL